MKKLFTHICLVVSILGMSMAFTDQSAYAAKDKPVTVTNAIDNPVLVDVAASRTPFRVYRQSLGLDAAVSRSGFNVGLFNVPKDVFFVIETVSAYVRFTPVPSSADPVDIMDIKVTFKEQDSIEVNGVLEISTIANTLLYDPASGLPTETTNSGTENSRVILSPGSSISWGFKVAGDSASRGVARITLFGYFVPAGSASYSP